MIYTVTFNPSLDYIVGVDEFKTGKVNRTAEELILPGGKGINVSIVTSKPGNGKYPTWFCRRVYRRRDSQTDERAEDRRAVCSG